jgi:hypothetical protein
MRCKVYTDDIKVVNKMATKPLKALKIRKINYKLTIDDIKNKKANSVEDVFEKALFNTNCEEERREIINALKDSNRETITSRYLNNMESFRFLSQERVNKNPEYYQYCTKERECINNNIKGYFATKEEATKSHVQILLDDKGIGYLYEYLSETNLLNEAIVLVRINELYKDDLNNQPNEHKQNYLKLFREVIEIFMQDFGLSKRRAIFLTRHLIQEHI